MRKKTLIVLLATAVVVLPAGALAKGGPKATYQFHGTLSAYIAAVGPTPGSITIVVSKANKAGRPFVGQTLTFRVASTTKVKPTRATITDGDLGTLQVKGASALDATSLQALAPKLVVDQTRH